MLRKIAPFILIIIGIIGFFFLVGMPQAIAFKLLKETTGPIENGTFIFLFLGAAFCLWRFLKIHKARLFWLEFGIIFYAMGLRELDPHRVLKDFNFLNGDFYANPHIHLAFKLFFAVSLFCLFGTFLHFFLRNFPLFINSLKKKQTWTFTAIGFLAAEFIASTHHKLVYFVFTSFFGVAQENLGFFVRALEEPFELIAALLLCLAAIQIPPSSPQYIQSA